MFEGSTPSSPAKFRRCYICKISKPLDNFYTGQYKCKDCHREYMKIYLRTNPDKRIDGIARKQQLRDEVKKYKESKGCADCKIMFPWYVLQFDHLRDKLFTISTFSGNISTERLWAEIAKCDVVCANCHSLRTYNRSL